jgi:hypothetical protein
MTDSDHDDKSNGWEPCPAGALSRSAAFEVAGHDRRVFLSQAVLTLFLGAAGCRAYFSSHDSKPEPQGDAISCLEVRADLAGYIQQSLDAGQIRKIESHLSACVACSNVYAQRLDELKQETGMGNLSNLFVQGRRA